MEGRVFYTYAWLREDGSPYYIGKGHGNRAWSNNRRRNKKAPSDKSRILILKKNLTEEEAFKHEVYMIAVFGRKDVGTGILWNYTDGGEGVSGYAHTLETRDKIRASHTGKKNGPPSVETRLKIGTPQRGKKLSEETKQRISAAKIGKPWTEARRLAQKPKQKPHPLLKSHARFQTEHRNPDHR